MDEKEKSQNISITTCTLQQSVRVITDQSNAAGVIIDQSNAVQGSLLTNQTKGNTSCKLNNSNIQILWFD
jgi:hypothetical protein